MYLSIFLLWISSHSTIPYNEFVDKAAKKSIILFPISNTPFFLDTHFSNSIHEQWKSLHSFFSFYHLCLIPLPLFLYLHFTVKLTRREEVIYFRHRISHASLTTNIVSLALPLNMPLLKLVINFRLLIFLSTVHSSKSIAYLLSSFLPSWYPKCHDLNNFFRFFQIR